MATVIAKLGDDVSTDVIYPGRYMATVLPTETPQFAFADNAELNGRLKSKQVPPGSVIAAGKNFARIFLQNSINLGLNLVTAPEIEASEGDELEVTADELVNKTTGKAFAVVPLPKARQAIIDAGGLIAYTRKRVMEAAGKA